MFTKAVCIAALLLGVTSEPPSSQYGAPLNSYGTPNYDVHNDHHEYGEPKSYEFGYQVKDDYTGNNYNRQEKSDGNQVRGEYRVQLPDGRTQIVTYYADWQTGFHADVRYEGTATYPEDYKTGGQYGAPGYGGSSSNQYGAPAHNNNYNGFNNNAPATSSVSIKDYSGAGTPYNVGGNQHSGSNFNNGYNNFGQGYSNNGGYDSYAGNYANKPKPNSAYGAP